MRSGDFSSLPALLLYAFTAHVFATDSFGSGSVVSSKIVT